MHDYAFKRIRGFRVDSTRGADVVWFDVRRHDLASVQMASASAITATIELVYANTDNKLYATLFSPTKELSANPDTEGDIDVSDIAFLGARIKTAGASSELVDFEFYATSAWGSGQADNQTPMEGR